MNHFEDLLAKAEALHPDLAPWLVDSKIGPCLKHPLVFSVPHSEELNALCNEQYRRKQEAVAHAKDRNDWPAFLLFHEKPYRFQAFAQIERHLSDEQFWRLLAETYIESENLWQNSDYLACYLNSSRPEKSHLMEPEELHWLTRLPEQVTIYRGYSKNRTRLGFSWTLSYNRASWFANRFRGGTILRGRCNKQDIHAVFLDRGEVEVVINPENVREVRKVSQLSSSPFFAKAKHQFQLGRTSHHGPSHWIQVERNALALCKLVAYADRQVCSLFAVFHDCKRINENDDPKHGPRAADFVVQLHKQGDLAITSQQLEKLAYACRFHNEGQTSDDPTIGVCWDADRLDLPRVSIFPEAKYLSRPKESLSLLFQV